jgi:hypothetical protein
VGKKPPTEPEEVLPPQRPLFVKVAVKSATFCSMENFSCHFVEVFGAFHFSSVRFVSHLIRYFGMYNPSVPSSTRIFIDWLVPPFHIRRSTTPHLFL